MYKLSNAVKIIVFLLLLAIIAQADSKHGVVIMPGIFSDNMVHTTESECPILG